MLRAALSAFGIILAAMGVIIVRGIGERLGPSADPFIYFVAGIGGLFLFFGLGLVVSVWLERPISRD